jgi:hypothetical protein
MSLPKSTPSSGGSAPTHREGPEHADIVLPPDHFLARARNVRDEYLPDGYEIVEPKAEWFRDSLVVAKEQLGSSTTKDIHVHSIGDMKLLDTPGLNDTNGLQTDTRNAIRKRVADHCKEGLRMCITNFNTIVTAKVLALLAAATTARTCIASRGSSIPPQRPSGKCLVRRVALVTALAVCLAGVGFTKFSSCPGATKCPGVPAAAQQHEEVPGVLPLSCKRPMLIEWPGVRAGAQLQEDEVLVTPPLSSREPEVTERPHNETA